MQCGCPVRQPLLVNAEARSVVASHVVVLDQASLESVQAAHAIQSNYDASRSL